MRSGYSSRTLERSSVPRPEPVPPPREWVIWKPVRACVCSQGGLGVRAGEGGLEGMACIHQPPGSCGHTNVRPRVTRRRHTGRHGGVRVCVCMYYLPWRVSQSSTSFRSRSSTESSSSCPSV